MIYRKPFNIYAYNMNFLIKTKLMVFDMAGTTINENGIVYKTLFKTLNQYGLNVTEKDIEKWHGSNKYEVLEHFLYKSFENDKKTNQYVNWKLTYRNYEIEKNTLNKSFENNLKAEYFDKSNISLIDESMPELFNYLRSQDIKIALNTGYNKEIQENIINKLHMNEFIDGYISSEDVKYGRPYPYMIHKLMEQFEIKNSKEVIKVGDTVNDILEGKNASCYTIGVLSGADDNNKLNKANYLLDSVMNIYYEK